MLFILFSSSLSKAHQTEQISNIQQIYKANITNGHSVINATIMISNQK